jgi:hypothetical protein
MKSGNVNKVAALDQVLGICNAHGASYTPSKASLQPTALRSLLELAQEKQKAVIVARNAYAMAVSARAENFEGMPKLATQIARMVRSSPASTRELEQVRTIQRRYHGPSKKKPSTTTVEGSETDATKTRRLSRMDFNSQLDTFRALIDIVRIIPGYAPVEPEFSIASLEIKLQAVVASCQSVADAAIALSNARIARDKVLYGDHGVIESIMDVKAYIRAKFGSNSPESRQPDAIHF